MLFEETVLAGTKSLLHLQNSAVAGEKPRDHGEYRWTAIPPTAA